MSEVKRLWAESGYISATQAGTRFIPATADEIKEAHGRCKTCKHLSVDVMLPDESIYDECTFIESHYYLIQINDPVEHYCRHHTPKEGV